MIDRLENKDNVTVKGPGNGRGFKKKRCIFIQLDCFSHINLIQYGNCNLALLS